MSDADRKTETGCLTLDGLARLRLEESDGPAEHLATCQRCRRLARELASVEQALGAEFASMQPASTCPDVEEWAAFVDGGLDDLRSKALVDHLTTCRRCARVWEYLVAVVEGAERDAAPVGRPRRRASPELHEPARGEGVVKQRAFAAHYLAAAAGMIAILILALLPITPIRSAGDYLWRGSTPQLSARAEWVDGGESLRLSWAPWKAASSYRVRVWLDSGEILLAREVTDTQADVRVSRTTDDSRIYWLVEALVENRVVATSFLNEEPYPERAPAPGAGVRE